MSAVSMTCMQAALAAAGGAYLYFHHELPRNGATPWQKSWGMATLGPQIMSCLA
jgi:hypothetical protein